LFEAQPDDWVFGMLEDYRIIHELTRTQNCQLLLAQQIKSGQKVVLKTPVFETDSDFSIEEQAARFRRECSIHLYLRHESIVPALDFFEESGRPYLATAYQPYPTLKYLNQQAARFSPLEALNIIQQLCQAMHYIHDQGVIHRDIHPENILITEEKRVLLMDFGCARKVFAPNITQEKMVQGAFCLQGTLYYMSPEQLLGQTDLDFRTDVFSVGVILYQLLTGVLPFEGQELQDVVQNLLANEQPQAIIELNPYVPESLEQMVFQALRKDPDYRTPTARKLALEIESLLDDPHLYYCEARWHLEQSKSIDSAQEYSLYALQKDPYHLPALHLLGQLFIRREAWEKAQRCYERILERDPQQAEAHFYLGQIESHFQNLMAACQRYERAWQLSPYQRDYRYGLAQSLHHLGRKYQAIEHLQALMEQEPDWVAPYAELGHIYYAEEQKEAALAYYQKARELAPQDPDILYALGALQHELGHYLEALNTYQDLLRHRPECLEVRHNLANLYYLLDELGESRRLLEKMLAEQARPREAKWEMTYRLLGFVYARINLHDEAIEMYKYAVLCCPTHLENYLFLATSYREQLQLQFAINTLQYVSELPIGRDEALVYFLLARAHCEQGKDKEAIQALQKCLRCYRTLSQSMAHQVREDLALLEERIKERLKEARVSRSRQQKHQHQRQAYSRDTSMNILSFPTTRRVV